MPNTKNFYSDALPNPTADLFTATVASTVLEIRMVNTDAVARVVNLYYKKSGGSDRLITPKNMSLDPGVLYKDPSRLVLGVGDKIRGDCDVAAKVDTVISGTEGA